MVLWIGVDDTDSLRGMCTTFLATELVRDLTRDYDLIGYPRLVRLNPNIPWKTRGNGAICLRLGRGAGPISTIGHIAGRDVVSHARSREDPSPVEVEAVVARVVERWACFEDRDTNPGYVILRRPPSPSLYWQAVRRIVEPELARSAVRELGISREYKDGRGIVGAAAATAWRPRDRTFEVLVYRHPDRWGTPRDVDPSSVIAMEAAFSSTFNSYDPENDRVVITPRTSCPILFGIRGDDPLDLPSAMRSVRAESADRWLLFETNQGTDDHVVRSGPLEPFMTGFVRGHVTAPPRTIRGGHVVFRVGAVDVTAYEPSKQFRSVVRQLIVGDRVVVVGALRDAPRTVNLEKLRVESLAPDLRKVLNPWCTPCSRRAKSLGHRAGFRCPRCRERFGESSATWLKVPRNLQTGWYEPPVGSRRHLSRPLSRGRRVASSPLAHRRNVDPL